MGTAFFIYGTVMNGTFVGLLTRSFEWKNFLSLTLFLFSLCFIFSGACFNPFAPELDERTDPSNIITDQQTPGEVLQNFRYAYTFKDSILYSDVLDQSFVFEYFDTNLEPSGGFRTWGRDVDLKTTGRLFRSFDVIELIWLNTLFTERETRSLNGEIIELIERQFIRFNLNLFSSDLNFIISGTAIFTFNQKQGDDKWRITRWKDESDI